MKPTFHFISGLPRSGSTLLSSILRQNPRFHAGITSLVYNLFAQVQLCMSARHEMHPLINDDMRRNVLRGLVSNYYADLDHRGVIFDTSRGWCGKLFLLNELFPDAKVICPVRSIPEIIDSIERIVHANPMEPSRMFDFDPMGNVYTRADYLMAPANGMVGRAFHGLKDAFYGEFSHKIVLVPYDVLTRRPAATMAELYEVLGEEPFEHDFDNVEYSSDEFDFSLGGSKGLHQVRQKVEHRPRAVKLPPDLRKKYDRTDFWNYPELNPGKVHIVGGQAGPAANAQPSLAAAKAAS